DSVMVVGHYRGHRYVTSALNLEYLENFRPELIYSPTVIERIKARGDYLFANLDGSDEAKQQVTELAANLATYARKILDWNEGRWAAQALIESLYASCGGVFHTHGRNDLFVQRDTESAQHILMRVFLWALFLPRYANLQVNVRVGGLLLEA